MTPIRDRLEAVRAHIHELAQHYGRDPAGITLLAVSKTQPVEALREALACGQLAFGENYAQELADKAAQLAHADLQWHFIGPLQANKTRQIAGIARWVHSIDRGKIARRLGEQRPDTLGPIQVCLQVNLDAEASKSGVTPQALPALAEAVAMQQGLDLRGLMAIPAPGKDFNQQRQAFARLRELKDSLIAQGHPLDTLSMGMSADMEAAIAEGTTIVRVGTAIFGERRRT
ncbi:MAG: YggS family pyridoxal phosphate-dependent enzyme [Thioalkalivibrio sp.]